MQMTLLFGYSFNSVSGWCDAPARKDDGSVFSHVHVTPVNHLQKQLQRNSSLVFVLKLTKWRVEKFLFPDFKTRKRTLSRVSSNVFFFLPSAKKYGSMQTRLPVWIWIAMLCPQEHNAKQTVLYHGLENREHGPTNGNHHIEWDDRWQLPNCSQSISLDGEDTSIFHEV